MKTFKSDFFVNLSGWAADGVEFVAAVIWNVACI